MKMDTWRSDRSGLGRLKPWQAYLVAVMATAATLGLRLALDAPLGGQPTLVIFTLPIMLSAYLGGLRAGLLATALSYFGASYYLLEPKYSFWDESAVERWQQSFVALAGVFISVLSEALHRARRRAGIAIDEYRQAEAALKESEGRYRAMVDWSPESIAVSRAGKILFVNPAAIKMMGATSKQDLVGTSVLDWVHPDFQQIVRERVKSQADDGGVLPLIEERFIKLDGTVIDVENQGTRIIYDGEPATFSSMRDITERKRVVAAAARLVAIVESSDDAIIGLDLNGIITSWNRGAERIFGYAAGEMAGSPITRVIPPDRHGEVEQVLSRIRQGESVEHFETVRIGKGGRRIDVSLTVSPIKNAAGDVVGASAVARDITERKTIERALESAEEQYHSIFNNAVDGIFRTSPDGKFLVANPAAARIFGFASPEELIEERQDIAQQGYVDPLRREEFKRLLQEQGVVNGFEYEGYRKDRSRVWISENTHAVHSPSGEILYFEGIFEDVTERKQAEEALRESEERFRTIFEQAPLGISEGEIAAVRFVNANQRYVAILGYTTDELRALTFKDYTHPEDLQKDLVEFQKLAAGEIRTYAMEKRYIRKDGAIIWANLTVSALAPPGEEPLNCMAVIEDITERRQAEQALRESEQRFRELAENINEVFWLSDDQNTRMHYISPAYEKVWGRSCQSLYAAPKSWMDAVHPEDKEQVLAHVAKRSLNEAYHNTYRIIRPDGSMRWIRDRGFTVRDESGVAVRFAGIAEDVTESKQAEDRLRRSEEKFKALFDLAPVGIAFLDSRLNIVDCNPALERMSRLSREELLGGAWQRRTFLNADGSPRLPGERVTERAVTEKRLVNRVETGAVMESGEIIWAEVSVAPLAVPDARAVVIMQDITERKGAEEALRKANRQLRILSRRRAQVQEDERKHLARELHDQIGQALTAAKISVQSAKHSKKREAIARHLDNTMTVLNQILRQVRQMTLDLRPAALDDLGLVPALRLVLDDYARRAGWHMQFSGDANLERADAEVETACFRITLEALTNILRHARARKVWLELHRGADSLHLIVRDDGVGFDLVDAEKRVERDRLGLVGMRERATGVGGAFECRSVVGRGTEVHAFLPFYPV